MMRAMWACTWVLTSGLACTANAPAADEAPLVLPPPIPSTGPYRGPTIEDLPPPGKHAEPVPSEELRARTGFPLPPRESRPNCGPEKRFKVDLVDSRARFVELLRALQYRDGDDSSNRYRFDDFRRPPISQDRDGKRIDGGEVDWTALEQAIVTEVEGGVTYHSLKYRPHGCSGYTVTVTNTGAASLFGCCGK
jgi:hypothetical protein